jgi:hypothetical protein
MEAVGKRRRRRRRRQTERKWPTRVLLRGPRNGYFLGNPKRNKPRKCERNKERLALRF